MSRATRTSCVSNFVNFIEYAVEWLAAKISGKSWIDYVSIKYRDSPVLYRKLAMVQQHVEELLAGTNNGASYPIAGTLLDLLYDVYKPQTDEAHVALNYVNKVMDSDERIQNWLSSEESMSCDTGHPHFLDHIQELWEYSTKTVYNEHSDFKEIGFQGRCPKSDFRCFEFLALDNMVSFAKNHCDHITVGARVGADENLPFAMTSMQVTALVVELFKEGHMSRLLYAWCFSDEFEDGLAPLTKLHDLLLVKVFEDWKAFGVSFNKFGVFWKHFCSQARKDLKIKSFDSYLLL